MKSLYLNIEDGVRIDVDALLCSEVVSAGSLIITLDVLKSLDDIRIVLVLKELLELASILDEAIANLL